MGTLTARQRRVRRLDHDPEALVWVRKQAGLSQKQLAEGLGISPSHMSEIESGTRNLTPAKLRAAAKLLNCPPAVLQRNYAAGEDVA